MFGQTVDVRTTLTGKSYYIALALEERKRGERRRNINTKLTNGERENERIGIVQRQQTIRKKQNKTNHTRTRKEISSSSSRWGWMFRSTRPPPPPI